MYVFDVVVIDKSSDEVVYDGRIVSISIEQAKILAMAEIMREGAQDNETIANYHFAVARIGYGYAKQVRREMP